jgi:hypothetical protein
MRTFARKFRQCDGQAWLESGNHGLKPIEMDRMMTGSKRHPQVTSKKGKNGNPKGNGITATAANWLPWLREIKIATSKLLATGDARRLDNGEAGSEEAAGGLDR